MELGVLIISTCTAAGREGLRALPSCSCKREVDLRPLMTCPALPRCLLCADGFHLAIPPGQFRIGWWEIDTAMIYTESSLVRVVPVTVISSGVRRLRPPVSAPAEPVLNVSVHICALLIQMIPQTVSSSFI